MYAYIFLFLPYAVKGLFGFGIQTDSKDSILSINTAVFPCFS